MIRLASLPSVRLCWRSRDQSIGSIRPLLASLDLSISATRKWNSMRTRILQCAIRERVGKVRSATTGRSAADCTWRCPTWARFDSLSVFGSATKLVKNLPLASHRGLMSSDISIVCGRGGRPIVFRRKTVAYLNDELAARPDSGVRMEVELCSYGSHERQRQTISRFEEAVRAADGEILHQSSIPEIAYEAALIRSS